MGVLIELPITIIRSTSNLEPRWFLLTIP